MSAVLRAVDSRVHCHAELRIPGIVLSVCQLPLGHDGNHQDGCTRWGFDDRPRAAS